MSDSAPFSVTPRDPSALAVVQLSDCHIFGQPGELLYGVDTRRSLDRVLERVAARHGAADLLLASGDLAQDASAGAYRYLAKRFDRLGMPAFWIPGNHDDPASMARHLRGTHWRADKSVVAGHWIIVLLDSTLPGEVHGRVAPAQLDFADAVLGRYRDRHALVVLHHQAVDCGSAWIDRKGYPDNAALRRRLLAHTNLRAVIWGHVHQHSAFGIGGVHWLSAPSTCAQFEPGNPEFAIGAEAPGYRWLRLGADGGIETAVERIAPD